MGVISAPNDAITHGAVSTIGYLGGPAFGIDSFYGTAFCRNFVRVNMTGYFRVRRGLIVMFRDCSNPCAARCCLPLGASRCSLVDSALRNAVAARDPITSNQLGRRACPA